MTEELHTMKKLTSKKLISYILALLMLLMVLAGCESSNTVFSGLLDDILNDELSDEASNEERTENQLLEVHFIDVGQADSILVLTPDNKAMLIDAGNNGDGNTVVSYLKAKNISTIDVLVGTHPHEDHIGGLDTVIKAFDVKSVYMPKVSSNTKTFEDVLTAINDKGLKVKTAKAGTSISLGSGIKTEIIAPNNDKYEDLNNYSAVIKLTYGSTAFLFMGDAEEKSEKEILNSGFNVKADVLKVGHHGSETSTSKEFLNAVSPDYAIISAGKDNKYNHPHDTTLEKLNKAGVKVYRTDKLGTIIMTSDGENISVK